MSQRKDTREVVTRVNNKWYGPLYSTNCIFVSKFVPLTISVLSDGGQGALNQHLALLVFSQVFLCWWVCTDFTSLLRPGYILSWGIDHVINLSMNSVTLSSSSTSIYQRHELQHEDVHCLDLETHFYNQHLIYVQ